MQLYTPRVDIPYDRAYVIVIGDLHIGDKAFGRVGLNKVRGYIDWVGEHPESRVFLNGDIFNCATRQSKTSPFEQEGGLKDHMKLARALFEPIKKQIVGAVDGNHELRLMDFCGYSPVESLCAILNIPYYGDSVVIKFRVGSRSRGKGREKTPNISYSFYFHHTTGGGGTPGGKLNRVYKMKDIIRDADVYCGSHNHALIAYPEDALLEGGRGSRILQKKQTFVSCGGYLEWHGSYAEKKMLPPAKIGSPRIRLNGKVRDVHVNT
jgi:hypothetical protein